MKLYFSPGACSLASHIALNEAGLDFTPVAVSLKDKSSKDGDLTKISPKGQVPALVLDNGQVLTEGAVILQYIADQKPAAKLLPPAGSFERYRAQEWLNYIATEVHKNFSGLFNPKAPAEQKTQLSETLGKKFDFLSSHLGSNQFLMGSSYSVADSYLFTCLSWSKPLKMDMAKWPKLMGYVESIQSRPAVQATVKAEQTA